MEAIPVNVVCSRMPSGQGEVSFTLPTGWRIGSLGLVEIRGLFRVAAMPDGPVRVDPERGYVVCRREDMALIRLQVRDLLLEHLEDNNGNGWGGR